MKISSLDSELHCTLIEEELKFDNVFIVDLLISFVRSEFETLTLSQQVARQCVPIWGKGGKFQIG